MSYTVTQWLLLFFMYSFFGWIWETGFVSVRKREWVNRGFLYGPLIPIYGFGAIIILWLTLPVKAWFPAVFVLGMLGATALEYCVGWLMEKMFHMRWWDYSDKPLNVNGYICLRCSLGWGCFSLLLVYAIHPPIEKLMLIVPETLGQILVLLLVVAIAVDTTKSVQSALDMKELLTRMRESNATLAKIEDRIGELAESAEEYSQNIRERLRESEENVYERLYEASAQKQERRESFEELLALRKSKKAERIATLSRRADVIIAVMREGTNGEKSEKLEKALSELREFKDILKRSEAELMSRSSNEYRKVVSILRRNPTATSHENSSLLSTFRELTERKRK